MTRSEQLRVLIVDDSSDDAQLIVEALGAHDHEIVSCRVDEAQALRTALGSGSWDIVISDYSMPRLTSEEALRIVTELDPNLPFIVVSGVIGEEAAVEMMRLGALDYVMKDRLGRLLPAILRELRDADTRKRADAAETAMRELRDRLEATVERAPVGIVNVGLDGRFLHVNPRFCDLIRYSRDELLALHVSEVTHPLDLGRDAQMMDEMAAGRLAEHRTEKRYLGKDGEIVWASVSTAPVRDGEGEVLYFAKIIVDVTDKKKMETALREREETALRQKKELEEAQRIAHVGSWRRDLPGDTMEWSDELYRIFGLDPSTLPTLTVVLDAALPEDREKVITAIAHAQEDGVPLDLDYRIMRPDGSIRSVHTFGEIARDSAGVAANIRGVTQDVTDRIAAATVTENLTRHLQLLLESTTQGIFGMDSDGRCSFINRAASDILGYAPGELVGALMHDVVHRTHDGTSYSAEDCPIGNAARMGVATEVQSDMLSRRDHRPLPVEYSAAPILDAGTVAGAVVVFTDVSERKLLQSQLEQADRVSSLGRLAATMAHEFNNVLMGIQPFAEHLTRLKAGHDVQGAASNILQTVQRGRSITQGILSFARPIEVVKEKIDVKEWLGSMRGALAAVVGEGVRLRVRVEGDSLFIRGDRHQLEQVLTNLAANARDAMKDVGELSIVVERCLSGYVFPFGAIKTVDRFLHLSVADTGCGMDTKTLKNIFDPFFTTKRSGTGLGLAVVHQVVQLHGGRIVPESVVGKGTVFHLFLPFSQEAFSETGSAKIAGQPSAAGSILLVEDDDAISSGVATLLRDEGAIVDVAASGAAALASLADHVPDVIILDVGLPDIDGRLLYAQIAEAYPDLAVVFASGSIDEEIFRPYLKPGRIASLTKPYELNALLLVLDTVKSGGEPICPPTVLEGHP